MPDSGKVTVVEVEKLRPDSEYIKCYKKYCELYHVEYNPNMLYSELPNLFKKVVQKEALKEAFKDICTNTDLWTAFGVRI